MKQHTAPLGLESQDLTTQVFLESRGHLGSTFWRAMNSGKFQGRDSLAKGKTGALVRMSSSLGTLVSTGVGVALCLAALCHVAGKGGWVRFSLEGSFRLGPWAGALSLTCFRLWGDIASLLTGFPAPFRASSPSAR